MIFLIVLLAPQFNWDNPFPTFFEFWAMTHRRVCRTFTCYAFAPDSSLCFQVFRGLPPAAWPDPLPRINYPAHVGFGLDIALIPFLCVLGLKLNLGLAHSNSFSRLFFRRAFVRPFCPLPHRLDVSAGPVIPRIIVPPPALRLIRPVPLPFLTPLLPPFCFRGISVRSPLSFFCSLQSFFPPFKPPMIPLSPGSPPFLSLMPPPVVGLILVRLFLRLFRGVCSPRHECFSSPSPFANSSFFLEGEGPLLDAPFHLWFGKEKFCSFVFLGAGYSWSRGPAAWPMVSGKRHPNSAFLCLSFHTPRSAFWF